MAQGVNKKITTQTLSSTMAKTAGIKTQGFKKPRTAETSVAPTSVLSLNFFRIIKKYSAWLDAKWVNKSFYKIFVV